MYTLLARAVELRLLTACSFVSSGSGVPGRHRNVEDVSVLEVASRRHVEVDGELGGIVAKGQLASSARRPEEELALLALAVGVLAAVEAAAGIGHLAQHVVQRLLGDAARNRRRR